MLRGTALTPKVSCLENRESESDGKLTCSKRLPFSGSFIFIRVRGLFCIRGDDGLVLLLKIFTYHFSYSCIRNIVKQTLKGGLDWTARIPD